MSHKIEKEWVTESGLKAAVLFVHESHYCGYVILDKDHPWYEDSYDAHYDLDVHGGLTFAGNISDIAPKGEVWALGFDAAHIGDATSFCSSPGDVFRDLDYMITECESLARQIKEATDG